MTFTPAAPPQVVSTGTAFAIVALRSHEALARLRVEQEGATTISARAWRPLVLCSGPNRRRTIRHGERGCSFMAARIRPQARRPDAPSAISFAMASWRRGRQIHVQQGVEIGRTSDLFLSCRSGFRQGTQCARCGQHCSRCKGAAFPAVMHTLSTEFNQAQVTFYVHCDAFSFVTRSFSCRCFASCSLFSCRLRSPYSCPSIERNSAGDFPAFITASNTI